MYFHLCNQLAIIHLIRYYLYVLLIFSLSLRNFLARKAPTFIKERIYQNICSSNDAIEFNIVSLLRRKSFEFLPNYSRGGTETCCKFLNPQWVREERRKGTDGMVFLREENKMMMLWRIEWVVNGSMCRVEDGKLLTKEEHRVKYVESFSPFEIERKYSTLVQGFLSLSATWLKWTKNIA